MSTDRLLSWAVMYPPILISLSFLYLAVQELDGTAAKGALLAGVVLAVSGVAGLVKRAREVHGRTRHDQRVDAQLAELRRADSCQRRDIELLRDQFEKEQITQAAHEAMGGLARRDQARHLRIARREKDTV